MCSAVRNLLGSRLVPSSWMSVILCGNAVLPSSDVSSSGLVIWMAVSLGLSFCIGRSSIVGVLSSTTPDAFPSLDSVVARGKKSIYG
mgnify:CR=1 FL=1